MLLSQQVNRPCASNRQHWPGQICTQITTCRTDQFAMCDDRHYRIQTSKKPSNSAMIHYIIANIQKIQNSSIWTVDVTTTHESTFAQIDKHIKTSNSIKLWSNIYCAQSRQQCMLCSQWPLSPGTVNSTTLLRDYCTPNCVV